MVISSFAHDQRWLIKLIHEVHDVYQKDNVKVSLLGFLAELYARIATPSCLSRKN